MKKKLFSVLAILVCASSIAMAKVPLNEAVLGGIYPGMPVQDMVQIYGDPIKEEVSYAAGIQVYDQKCITAILSISMLTVTPQAVPLK